MKQQIEAAFAHRQRPATVTEIAVNSELRDDAPQGKLRQAPGDKMQMFAGHGYQIY